MPDILAVDGLTAGYGAATVISGVSFRMAEGQSLALLGRNGVGKTTLVDTIVGLTRHRGGTIAFAGQDVTRSPPEKRARAGIGWVPQERGIFPSLTVEENLLAFRRPGPWDLERAYGMFPRLRERRANWGNQLSGGEQQMLSVARALLLNPRLLLLDEPTEGLAPILVEELLAALKRVVVDEGLSTIIVEQKPREILGVVEAALILDRGTVVHSGPSADLLARPELLDGFLGVRAGALAPA